MHFSFSTGTCDHCDVILDPTSYVDGSQYSKEDQVSYLLIFSKNLYVIVYQSSL
jgi:hypothetical protein